MEPMRKILLTLLVLPVLMVVSVGCSSEKGNQVIDQGDAPVDTSVDDPGITEDVGQE